MRTQPPATPQSRVLKPLRPEALRPRLSTGLPNQFLQLMRSLFFFNCLSRTTGNPRAISELSGRLCFTVEVLFDNHLHAKVTVKQLMASKFEEHGTTTRSARFLSDRQQILPWANSWRWSNNHFFRATITDLFSATVVQPLQPRGAGRALSCSYVARHFAGNAN